MSNNGLSLIGYWWICLSVLSTSCLWIGFYVPHWIVGKITLNGRKSDAYLSAFRRCNYPIWDEKAQHFRMSDYCGIYSSFYEIPSIYWQISSVSIGVGCFLALVLTLILIPSCCFQNITTKSSSVLIGMIQVISALNVTFGCCLFAIWDNNEVKDACGQHVGKFMLGDCHIGWAFVCMLTGSAMLLICGMLSTCSTRSINDAPHNPIRLTRDEHSFDAETLINNNLRVASSSLPSHKWHKYDAKSPFVPRHSELV